MDSKVKEFHKELSKRMEKEDQNSYVTCDFRGRTPFGEEYLFTIHSYKGVENYVLANQGGEWGFIRVFPA